MAFTLLLLFAAVITKTVLADVVVTCDEDSMSVTVAQSDVPRYIGGDGLSLSDRACLGTNDGSSVTFKLGYKTCGTELVVEAQHLYFRNRILSLPADPSLVIWRKVPISIEFGCRFSTSKQEALPQHLRPLAEQIIGTSASSGDLKVNLELTDKAGAVIGNGGLIDVNVGEVVNVRLSGAKLQANGLRVSATKCFVTLDNNPASTPSYNLIAGGCSRDPTTFLAGGDGPDYRFNFEAFAFISDPSKPLFLHCDAVVCDSGDKASVCAAGCSAKRKRRSARNVINNLMGIITFKHRMK